ncbi:zinc-binding dehydrogenase [Nonomuraea typhae]|uniref:zinc-binding dehydrogenase n=1 Tax=Nonomuraea typhae TaxID=2603600 RepID=UPI0015E1C27E|nr:zinc-binding dehydrogenase [Nonomuraea typhae]
MNIVEVTRFGGPEVLQVRQAAPVSDGAGEVVIGVSAVDVMSLDAQLRTGWGREWFGTEPPYVPGTGVAGVVLATGAGVDASWAGRRVAAFLPGGGGYAERAVAPLATTVVVPDSLGLAEAAALVQVGPAALSLVAAAELKPGSRVLVTGAGGALGLALVELAVRAGAHVVAAAHGAAKRERALELGAASAVDYTALTGAVDSPAPTAAVGYSARTAAVDEPVGAATGTARLPDGFDVVFDGVGGQVGADAFALARRGGVVFAYGVPSGGFAAVSPEEAGRRGVRLVGVEQVQFGEEEFHRLATATMSAGITPSIGLAVPLDQAHLAHAALEARALVGKAVLLTTSRAVRYSEYGAADVLRVDEVPIPVPGPGQVRVAVRAAGVNAVDWKIRSGMFGAPLEGPAGTGIEFSGVVEAAGAGVSGVRAGQEVVGRGTGALADHVLAVPDDLAPKPEGLTHVEAAALPVAVETARRALGLLEPVAGQTLLIHAAAGGVGLAAAQLAIGAGLRVIGTASEANHDYLRGLGVRPVGYGDGLEERIGERVDLVLDASGREVVEASVRLTGDPGKVVSVADPGAGRYGARFTSGSDDPTPLHEISGHIGRVRLPIAAEYPLEEAAAAHRHSENGHLLGKIVVNAEARVPR